MSHNCKLFNPSAGKLTVLHWWLCVQTQGGPVKGGKLRGLIYQYPPQFIWKWVTSSLHYGNTIEVLFFFSKTSTQFRKFWKQGISLAWSLWYWNYLYPSKIQKKINRVVATHNYILILDTMWNLKPFFIYWKSLCNFRFVLHAAMHAFHAKYLHVRLEQ